MAHELSDREYQRLKIDHDLALATVEKYIAYMDAWKAYDEAGKRFALGVGDELGVWQDRLRGIEESA